MSHVESLLLREQTPLKRVRRQVHAHRRLSGASAAIVIATLACGAVYIATRPPRHELLIDAAFESVQVRNFVDAIARLEEAELAFPADGSIDDRIRLRASRGLARIDAGQFREAYQDLIETAELDESDPVPWAWAAFALSTAACLERDTTSSTAFEADIEVALQHYLQAERLSPVPATALRFDIAYCYVLKREPDQAAQIVDELIDDGCRLHNVWHLKAILDLTQPGSSGSRMPDPKCIETAIRLAPPSRQYCFDASCIYAKVARLSAPSERDAALAMAVDYWGQAVLQGAPRSDAEQLTIWCPELEEDARFQEITAGAADVPEPVPSSPFLEPLDR
jgi:tetratricopeptide (TPR) repeat protein